MRSCNNNVSLDECDELEFTLHVPTNGLNIRGRPSDLRVCHSVEFCEVYSAQRNGIRRDEFHLYSFNGMARAGSICYSTIPAVNLSFIRPTPGVMWLPRQPSLPLPRSCRGDRGLCGSHQPGKVSSFLGRNRMSQTGTSSAMDSTGQ